MNANTICTAICTVASRIAASMRRSRFTVGLLCYVRYKWQYNAGTSLVSSSCEGVVVVHEPCTRVKGMLTKYYPKGDLHGLLR